MENQNRNNGSKGRVRYSSRNVAKCSKFRLRVEATGLAVTAFLTGLGVGVAATLDQANQTPTTIVGTVNPSDTNVDPIVNGGYETPSTPSKNDFMHDAIYTDGGVITLEDCDFSNMSVVLDTADESSKTYETLYSAKTSFDSKGIECSLVPYYEDTTETLKGIRNNSNKTIFVVTVQDGKNSTQENLISTNFSNGVSASNSSDAFALSTCQELPHSVVKKGLAEDLNNYDRRESSMESQINKLGLTNVKSITIRPSMFTTSQELSEAIVDGVVRASTLNNDIIYLKRIDSVDGYPNLSNIKTQYPDAQLLNPKETDSKDSTVIINKVPKQLTSTITVSHSQKSPTM